MVNISKTSLRDNEHVKPPSAEQIPNNYRLGSTGVFCALHSRTCPGELACLKDNTAKQTGAPDMRADRSLTRSCQGQSFPPAVLERFQRKCSGHFALSTRDSRRPARYRSVRLAPNRKLSWFIPPGGKVRTYVTTAAGTCLAFTYVYCCRNEVVCG
jgi:hypothetical protein